MNLEGKVVLITGSASGIGAETARYLASLGAKLSLVDLNEQLLTKVTEEIVQRGCLKPLSIIANVTTEAERIINVSVEHYGQLDVLVNCAGIGSTDTVDEFDVRVFDRTMDTNLKSMISLTSWAIPHLEKTRGNIVNVSSVLGINGSPIWLSYCLSKAGVSQFTKCAALALASKNIRVNAIAPGFIRTPIFNLSAADLSKFIESKKGDNLVDRVGEPADVARGIAYLASEPWRIIVQGHSYELNV